MIALKAWKIGPLWVRNRRKDSVKIRRNPSLQQTEQVRFAVRFTIRLSSIIIPFFFENVQMLHNKSIPNRYFLGCANTNFVNTTTSPPRPLYLMFPWTFTLIENIESYLSMLPSLYEMGFPS